MDQNPLLIYLEFAPAIAIALLTLFFVFKKVGGNSHRSYLFSLTTSVIALITTIIFVAYSFLAASAVGLFFPGTPTGIEIFYTIIILSFLAVFYRNDQDKLLFQKMRKIFLICVNGLFILVFFFGLSVTIIDGYQEGLVGGISKEKAAEIAEQQLKPGLEHKLDSVNDKFFTGSEYNYDVNYSIYENEELTATCMVVIGAKQGEVESVEDTCKGGPGWIPPELSSPASATPIVTPSSSTGGIGIILGYTTGGNDMVIRGITPGSPAERAGLTKGDKIISIDGQSTLPPMDLDQAQEKIRGQTGTNVILVTIGEDSSQRTFEITREKSYT